MAIGSGLELQIISQPKCGEALEAVSDTSRREHLTIIFTNHFNSTPQMID
jgi:hypothetical protein